MILIGDVDGAANYHVGDEAMLQVAIEQLRLRGVADIVVVAGAPDEVANRYAVQAVARFGFAEIRSSRNRCEERLDRIIAAARGRASALDASDTAWTIIEAFAESDGALIAGGGNLTSAFRDHVYERAAFAAVADATGVPLVISGQGIGPELDARDGQLVARLLGSARLVGVRGASSERLTQELGVDPARLWRQLDDAILLAPAEVDLSALGVGSAPFIAMSFPDYSGELDPGVYLDELSAFVAEVMETTSAAVVLLPHEGELGAAAGAQAGDSRLLDAITAVGAILLPVLPADQVAAVTSRAALSISARYHSIVFANAAGVPAIGIWLDRYTRTKLQDALDNVGASALALPAAAIGTGLASDLVADVWARRDQLESALTATARLERTRAAKWWDEVVASVSGATGRTPSNADPIDSISLSSRIVRRRASLIANVDALESRRDFAIAEAADARSEARRSAAHAAESNLTVLALAGPQPDVTSELELETLRQALWERERFSAAVARESKEFAREAREVGRRLDEQIALTAAVEADLDLERSRGDALLQSSSWRIMRPLRVLAHPGRYLRALAGR
jgi:colanic acid/amylovoran biosynthesis protein